MVFQFWVAQQLDDYARPPLRPIPAIVEVYRQAAAMMGADPHDSPHISDRPENVREEGLFLQQL